MISLLGYIDEDLKNWSVRSSRVPQVLAARPARGLLADFSEPGVALEQVAGDRAALDLVGALVDAQ